MGWNAWHVVHDGSERERERRRDVWGGMLGMLCMMVPRERERRRNVWGGMLGMLCMMVLSEREGGMCGVECLAC